jgi:hypothetical protein
LKQDPRWQPRRDSRCWSTRRRAGRKGSHRAEGTGFPDLCSHPGRYAGVARSSAGSSGRSAGAGRRNPLTGGTAIQKPSHARQTICGWGFHVLGSSIRHPERAATALETHGQPPRRWSYLDQRFRSTWSNSSQILTRTDIPTKQTFQAASPNERPRDRATPWMYLRPFVYSSSLCKCSNIRGASVPSADNSVK